MFSQQNEVNDSVKLHVELLAAEAVHKWNKHRKSTKYCFFSTELLTKKEDEASFPLSWFPKQIRKATGGWTRINNAAKHVREQLLLSLCRPRGLHSPTWSTASTCLRPLKLMSPTYIFTKQDRAVQATSIKVLFGQISLVQIFYHVLLPAWRWHEVRRKAMCLQLLCEGFVSASK